MKQINLVKKLTQSVSLMHTTNYIDYFKNSDIMVTDASKVL